MSLTATEIAPIKAEPSVQSTALPEPVIGNSPESTSAPVPTPSSASYSGPLHGWQFAGALFVLTFGYLLSVIETSITATALVSIGKHFNDPIKATWVVLGYLLAYMGFAIIFARLSDGIGRRGVLIVSWLFFGAFSLGGGLAKTLNQLIVCRVMQGIGGSGLYTMTFVLGVQITPVKFYGIFSGLMGITYAIGSVAAPILGGVITEKSTWRWVYLFNAPCTIVGILTCVLFLPSEGKGSKGSTFSLAAIKSIDYLGAALILVSSSLLVFALQEAGSAAYAWNSGVIIATLTIASASWVGFFAWISHLTYGPKDGQKPILPMNVLLSRPTGPAILVVLFAGFPYFVALINLPQRFQIVNGDTPILAGVHLLPLLCSVAVGAAVGAGISSKKNVTSYTAIVASCLTILGCGLFSTISGGRAIDKAVYGYEIIFGLGNGMIFSSMTMTVNLVSAREDNAAAQGAVSQARMLGGSIGLSIATIVFNADLVRALAGSLTPAELRNLQRSLSTISQLTPEQQAAVAKVYADSFNAQMRICTYVSAFCVLAALATWQRNPVSIEAVREKERANGEKAREEKVEGKIN